MGNKWNHENRARLREVAAEWRAGNRDAIRRYHKQWHIDHPGHRRGYSQTYKLKSEYGLTVEDYDALLTEQAGRCAVCRTDKPGGPPDRTRFAVDHCHATGRIRGLLCFRCNITLGHHEKHYLQHREAFDAYLQKVKT